MSDYNEFNCSCEPGGQSCICPKSVSIKETSLGVCETSDGETMTWVKLNVEMITDEALTCNNECVYTANIRIYDQDTEEIYNEDHDFNLLLANVDTSSKTVDFWFQKTFLGKCIENASFYVCVRSAFKPDGYPFTTAELPNGWLTDDPPYDGKLENTEVTFCDLELPTTPTQTPTLDTCCSTCDLTMAENSQDCENPSECLPCNLASVIQNTTATVIGDGCTDESEVVVEYDVVGTLAAELLIELALSSSTAYDEYNPGVYETYLTSAGEVHGKHIIHIPHDVEGVVSRQIKISAVREISEFEYIGFNEDFIAF